MEFRNKQINFTYVGNHYCIPIIITGSVLDAGNLHMKKTSPS